jgi:hypothetical protein
MSRMIQIRNVPDELHRLAEGTVPASSPGNPRPVGGFCD